MLKLFFVYVLLTSILFPAWVISTDDRIIDDVIAKCKDLDMNRERVLFVFLTVLSALAFLFVPYKMFKDTIRKLEERK